MDRCDSVHSSILIYSITISGRVVMLRRRLKPIALAGLVSGGALYAYDELALCQVMQRSIRALACGVAIFIDYKLIWTPYNASEVHTRVARRIVDTCKLNEGLYVKFGQVMGSMEVAMPPEFKGPLGELHDQAKTFDTETVLQIMQEELSAEELAGITDISSTPVASASVAQVHTARLRGE
jgi:predicted unusual protein kinase regulating ubiquinone biosynthesis (AarF/ABC1/UbiB family)